MTEEPVFLLDSNICIYVLEGLSKAARDRVERCAPGEVVTPADLTIGSFLDCWSIDCYLAAYSRAVVEFNDAEWAEKCRKTLLDAATARVAALEKTYTDLVTKRRDTILASLKADGCCKSC